MLLRGRPPAIRKRLGDCSLARSPEENIQASRGPGGGGRGVCKDAVTLLLDCRLIGLATEAEDPGKPRALFSGNQLIHKAISSSLPYSP